jgi:CBS domain-containing protein
MRCQDIMKRDVYFVTPDTTVDIAAGKMRAYGVGFLPVCNTSLRVLGTITDRDITCRLVADGRPSDTFVRHVMTNEVVACRPDDDVRTAEALMSTYRKSRIMCIDETERLCGVISLSDVVHRERKGRAVETMRAVTFRELQP